MSNIAYIAQNPIDSIAQELMGQLVNFTKLDKNRISINTPVVCPNGDSVAVEVRLNPDGNFLVSDGGSTYVESILMQEEIVSYFKKSAKKWASHVGAKFDGEQIYFNDVPAKDLDAEVVMLAYCCQMCLIDVQKFVAKDIEKEIKLVSHKPLKLVKKEVQDTIKSFDLNILQDKKFNGKSKQWEFDNAISVGEHGKKICFEVLTPQEDIIHRAVAKLYDVWEHEKNKENKTIDLFAVFDKKEEVESGNIKLLENFCNTLGVANEEFSNEIERLKAVA